jgi:hypothetical protein
MSRGQVRSKQWLLHQLEVINMTNLGSVVVCGGWYGLLSRMLLDSPIFHIAFIDSQDLDPIANVIASELNSEYFNSEQFLYQTINSCDVDANLMLYNTVINTSCEHFSREDMNTFGCRIVPGTRVIIQSNDYREIDDHINCVDSADELAEQIDFSEILFKGALPTLKYTRYMVIGIR